MRCCQLMDIHLTCVYYIDYRWTNIISKVNLCLYNNKSIDKKGGEKEKRDGQKKKAEADGDEVTDWN